MKKIDDEIFKNRDVVKVDVIGTSNRPEKTKSVEYTTYIVEIEIG